MFEIVRVKKKIVSTSLIENHSNNRYSNNRYYFQPEIEKLLEKEG